MKGDTYANILILSLQVFGNKDKSLYIYIRTHIYISCIPVKVKRA